MRDKGWLQAQMRSAKKEVGNWHGWKKDTLRQEISSRTADDRGASIVLRSASTGRFVVVHRKKK